MDVSWNLGPTKNKLYGHVGKYLIEHFDDNEKLKLWANDVLEKFGHVDDSSKRLVFPIDMRWVAHLIKSIAENNIDDGYLRVSSKHGSVPILVANQTQGEITVFSTTNGLFESGQLKLPNFYH